MLIEYYCDLFWKEEVMLLSKMEKRGKKQPTDRPDSTLLQATTS